jgi:small-conductance mechanosensitive channel
MASLSSLLRNFIVFLVVIGIAVYVINFAFGTLIPSGASFLGLEVSMRQLVQSLMVVIAGCLVVVLIRRFANNIRRFAGPYPASVLSYTLVVLDFFVMIVTILGIFNVPANSLLLGGSFGAIIVGLAISTLFGNVFSGALMLFAKPVAVGDQVLVNSIPGRIEEISTLFTRIENESGTQTIIPNTALISGAVTLTKVPSSSAIASRLPFKAGDRVYTSYVGGEGVVKLVESLYTTVALDDGKEVKIPNNGIMTGNIHVAIIDATSESSLRFSLKVNWDAERTIKALEAEAEAAPDLFKSPLQVLYSSLDDEEAELDVSCEVAGSRKAEAKSRLIRKAYLTRKRPEDYPSG